LSLCMRESKQQDRNNPSMLAKLLEFFQIDTLVFVRILNILFL
jgi:hypothetical protein